jgi:predicted site-specific integrase-resolvase
MQTDKILNVREMADELHCSEATVEKSIKAGLIPVTRGLTGKIITTQSVLAEAVRASIQSQTK